MKKALTDRQKFIHARNKAMRPAMVKHPLRFIGLMTNKEVVKDGVKVIEASEDFNEAYFMARIGSGGFVQRRAMAIWESIK